MSNIVSLSLYRSATLYISSTSTSTTIQNINLEDGSSLVINTNVIILSNKISYIGESTPDLSPFNTSTFSFGLPLQPKVIMLQYINILNDFN